MGIVVFILVAILFLLAVAHGGGSDTGYSGSESGSRRMEEAKCGEETDMRAGTTRTLPLPGGTRMEMVWCPPGTFTMGSPEDEEGHRRDEEQREVTLAEGFWMAKFPVTQKQWKSVMGSNPSHFKGNSLPVEHVSWLDCMAFCKKTGLSLPTEAQWEYACRAGSKGPYAGTGNLDSMGWNSEVNDCRSTHPVGRKAPNAWGLYDMHGNVEEWCLDVWNEAKPSGMPFDPESAGTCTGCVTRGGSIWFGGCRAASRSYAEPDFHEDPFGAPIKLVGFRPVARGN